MKFSDYLKTENFRRDKLYNSVLHSALHVNTTGGKLF